MNPTLIEHRRFFDHEQRQHYSEYRIPLGALLREIITACPVGTPDARLKKQVKISVARFLDDQQLKPRTKRRKREHSPESDLKRAATLIKKALENEERRAGHQSAINSFRAVVLPEIAGFFQDSELAITNTDNDLGEFRCATSVTWVEPEELPLMAENFDTLSNTEDVTKIPPTPTTAPDTTVQREHAAAPFAPPACSLPARAHVESKSNAVQAVELFASVGVVEFEAKTGPESHLAYERGLSVELMRKEVDAAIAAAESWGSDHFILRPRIGEGGNVALIQLDDLPTERWAEAAEWAFIGLQTSQRNHQAWLAVELESFASEPDEEKRHALWETNRQRVRRGLIKHFGADILASGAGRFPGSKNFKYKPAFTVRLIHSASGRVIAQSEIEHLLPAAEVEAAEPADKRTPNYTFGVRPFPSWQQERDSLTSSRSEVDWHWSLKAIDRGHGVEETIDELMRVSPKAKEKGRVYAKRTVERAADSVRASGSARGVSGAASNPRK